MPRILLVMVVWLFALKATVSSADPKQTTSEVRDAARYGVEGNIAEQRERLSSLVIGQPDLVVARGHLGQVRHGKAWIDFEELVTLPAEVQKRRDYEMARESAPDTLEGQLELANWCQRLGLLDQERAHLGRVLSFDPEHGAVRSRLGFVRRNGEWVSSAARRAADTRQLEQVSALRKWRPKLREIMAGLTHKHRDTPDHIRERERQLAQLGKITDSAAISAIELELAAYMSRLDAQPGSTEHKIEHVILPLVRTIGGIPQPEAAASLTRIALDFALAVPMELPEAFAVDTYGPRYPSIEELKRVSPLARRLPRESSAAFSEAINQLRRHPRDSFVPLLLSGLSSPIQGEFLAYRERDGDVVVRLFYSREIEGRRERQENRTSYQPIGNHPEGLARSVALSGERATAQLETAHQQLQLVNQVVLHRNLRVTDILRATTDQPLSTEPQSWWQWWLADNEVFVEGDKPTVSNVQKQSISVLAPPPPPPVWMTSGVAYGGAGSAIGTTTITSGGDATDCLTAGTLIWTNGGYATVESITTGDLVLAQHPATGELAYKPVLRSTRRPRGPLVKLQVNGETFRTSGGHPFWVVGEGWVQARRLTAGQKLYGIKGAATIEHVENSTDAEPTFNLVVADFHCYFAGRSRILSHDNTVRAPIGMALPGLAQVKRSSP